MRVAKLISIDTSIFGVLAKDYFSSDLIKRQRAKLTVDYINHSGFIPFFTFHHIQEIIQHKNRGVVFNRWSLIKKFHTVAWLSCYEDSNILGSVIDIHKLEVKSCIDFGFVDLAHLRAIIREQLIKYCVGEWFVDNFERVYMQLRDIGAIDLNRNKEIESLSHIQDKRINSLKLSELNKSKLRPKHELIDFLQRHQKKMEAGLLSQGDKLLRDAKQSSQYFTGSVVEHASPLYLSNNENLYKAFVQNSGVRLDQVTPNTKVGELGYLSIYNKRLQIILESLNLPADLAYNLRPEDSSIWNIWRFLDEAMKNEKRAHGSNVIDRDMSILALCVDVFTVDKRVKEYLRQFSIKKPELCKSFGAVVKLSTYSDLSLD